MTDAIQAPHELPWLHQIFTSVYLVLKEIWQIAQDESTTVRSCWLVSLFDYRQWAHIFKDNQSRVHELYNGQLMLLMTLPTGQPNEIKEAYWQWLEQEILEDVMQFDQALYNALIVEAKKHIENGVAAAPPLESQP